MVLEVAESHVLEYNLSSHVVQLGRAGLALFCVFRGIGQRFT